MTEGQFEVQMDRMRAVFGKKAYENKVVIAMIWNAVNNLNHEPFIKIVNHFIASMRKPPLPVDFMEAARAERKIFSRDDAPAKSYAHKCHKCLDVGVLSVRKGGIYSMALCSCESANWQPWALPVYKILDGWEEFALQAKDFKIAMPAAHGDEETISRKTWGAIANKREWWIENVRIAEAFWASGGSEAERHL